MLSRQISKAMQHGDRANQLLSEHANTLHMQPK
jgi:hypothetical protein